MEAATKRARSGGGSAARDRLSALPDELRHSILSFLPAQEVVRTTVLSKRWVDLWRSVLAINLDTRDFHDTANVLGNWEKTKDFVTNLLMLHNAGPLDVFKLFIFSVNDDTCQEVHSWICRAIKYRPLVFKISVCACSSSYQLHFPYLGSSLYRLKKLELAGLHLGHSFAKQIHSWCPVLEDLVLWNCRNEFPGIQSDTLKNLVVHCCISETADVLLIRAPALSSVQVDFNCFGYKNGALLEAGHSLVRASISPFGNVSQRGQTEMLRGLFNVASLDLHGFIAKAVLDLDKELDELPIFDNLRTLSLNNCFYSQFDVHKLKALGRFLLKCPILEKLTLKSFWYIEGSRRVQQMVGKPMVKTVKPVVGSIEFPMLENLRTLFLEKCDLRDNYRLLRHLLEKFPNLERLTIRICKLPGASNGEKGKDMHFQCQNLKSTEIIYKKGGKIPALVSILLDISGSASKNTITLTKF